MENKEKTATARKLTLEEIEALPFASVIWMSSTNNDNGVIWTWKLPVVIGCPGTYGIIVGGNDDGIFERYIDEHLFDAPGLCFWDSEPDDSQIPGITEEEYNATPDEYEDIVFTKLTAEITTRGITFDRFCKHIGMSKKRFMDKVTGKKEFMQPELVSIRCALNLTDDETRDIFFPEFEGMKYDSRGTLIKEASPAQI